MDPEFNQAFIQPTVIEVKHWKPVIIKEESVELKIHMHRQFNKSNVNDWSFGQVEIIEDIDFW